jgi:hypothetical protein
MKTYTFKLNNNNNTNTTFSNNFFHTKSTDYSKILDDLILDDIIEKNSWLGITKKNNDLIDNLIDESKKYDYTTFTNNDFNNAALFIYNLDKGYCPFKKDKTYELSDGTMITITDDYIHINEKMYFFNQFSDTIFLNSLPKKEKKTICTIYTDSLKITIKK